MSSSNALNIPPHYLANTAASLGLFITANNIYGALYPGGALRLLGFPSPIAPSDKTLVEGVIRMFATTRIALGATMLATWYYKEWKGLGWSLVVGCVMAISDGLVSKQVSGKGEWGHWGAMPVGLAVGAGLLILDE